MLRRDGLCWSILSEWRTQRTEAELEKARKVAEPGGVCSHTAKQVHSSTEPVILTRGGPKDGVRSEGFEREGVTHQKYGR